MAAGVSEMPVGHPPWTPTHEVRENRLWNMPLDQQKCFYASTTIRQQALQLAEV
jgi:hypothetical protein